MVAKNQDRLRFQHTVFERDGGCCIVPDCARAAVDAHHLIERSLWVESDEHGGYLLNNGVSLCARCHKLAELGALPVDALRYWAGIKDVILPRGLDLAGIYDKWGRVIRQAPDRWPVKYPGTPYFPWSFTIGEVGGEDDEDFAAGSYTCNPKDFLNKPLVVLVKMDGSNALLTRDLVAARNATTAFHKSFALLKARHAAFKYLLEPGEQLLGEWLYAKHSIHYAVDGQGPPLKALFQAFGCYRRELGLFGGWAAVCELSKRLGQVTVPVLRQAVVFHKEHELIATTMRLAKGCIETGHEGIVVRSLYPFHYYEFRRNVAKIVRPNHVQTDKHWSQCPVVKNWVEEESSVKE